MSELDPGGSTSLMCCYWELELGKGSFVGRARLGSFWDGSRTGTCFKMTREGLLGRWRVLGGKEGAGSEPQPRATEGGQGLPLGGDWQIDWPATVRCGDGLWTRCQPAPLSTPAF